MLNKAIIYLLLLIKFDSKFDLLRFKNVDEI